MTKVTNTTSFELWALAKSANPSGNALYVPRQNSAYLSEAVHFLASFDGHSHEKFLGAAPGYVKV